MEKNTKPRRSEKRVKGAKKSPIQVDPNPDSILITKINRPQITYNWNDQTKKPYTPITRKKKKKKKSHVSPEFGEVKKPWLSRLSECY